jgi:hypothetical protein
MLEVYESEELLTPASEERRGQQRHGPSEPGVLDCLAVGM